MEGYPLTPNFLPLNNNKKTKMKKMKKIVLMFALLVTSLSASAQYDPGTWSMQVKFGFGASQLTNMEKIPLSDSNADSKFKRASMFGVDAQYQVANWFGIQSGINFWWQGCGWEGFVEDNIKFELSRNFKAEIRS